jgi:hypothetical protein
LPELFKTHLQHFGLGYLKEMAMAADGDGQKKSARMCSARKWLIH